jgi:hypothetical protein
MQHGFAISQPNFTLYQPLQPWQTDQVHSGGELVEKTGDFCEHLRHAPLDELISDSHNVEQMGETLERFSKAGKMAGLMGGAFGMLGACAEAQNAAKHLAQGKPLAAIGDAGKGAGNLANTAQAGMQVAKNAEGLALKVAPKLGEAASVVAKGAEVAEKAAPFLKFLGPIAGGIAGAVDLYKCVTDTDPGQKALDGEKAALNLGGAALTFVPGIGPLLGGACMMGAAALEVGEHLKPGEGHHEEENSPYRTTCWPKECAIWPAPNPI